MAGPVLQLTSAPAPRLGRGLRAAGLVGGVAVSAAVSGWIVGMSARSLSGNRMAPWILGRAAGICAYVLLVTLVLLGLLLSHPARTRTGQRRARRIQLHITISVFVLVFTVLHVVVLATDRYAGVGWWGALLPMSATYRPVPVTLGVIALWAGLAAGVTASLAGRIPLRIWWPVHKVAGGSLVLIWGHGVLAGSDSKALLALYLVSALVVGAVAVSRYIARRPQDVVIGDDR